MTSFSIDEICDLYNTVLLGTNAAGKLVNFNDTINAPLTAMILAAESGEQITSLKFHCRPTSNAEVSITKQSDTANKYQISYSTTEITTSDIGKAYLIFRAAFELQDAPTIIERPGEALIETVQTDGYVWGGVVDGVEFAIRPLMFHIALYVNPTPFGGYEERYCISNLELALKAVEDFKTSQRIRFWQKHHNKGISIVGKLAYNEGSLYEPQYSIPESQINIDWDATELRKQYPAVHANPMHR